MELARGAHPPRVLFSAPSRKNTGASDASKLSHRTARNQRPLVFGYTKLETLPAALKCALPRRSQAKTGAAIPPSLARFVIFPDPPSSFGCRLAAPAPLR